MVQVAGGGGSEQKGSGDRKRLRNRVDRWENIRAQIEELLDRQSLTTVEQTLLTDLRDSRAELVDSIQRIVENRPKLRDEAIKWGFREDLLPAAVTTPGTSADERAAEQHGMGTGTEGETTKERRRRTETEDHDFDGFEKRLGRKGKDYIIVRRDGRQYALYTYNISGNKVEVLLRVPKGEENRYGVNPNEGRTISDKRWAKAEVIGGADELPLKNMPKDALKEVQRYLERVYGPSAVTEDDQVMAVFIGAEMLNYSPEEIAGSLRRTTWFKNSSEWERRFVRDFSPEERREQIRNSKQDVIQALENTYGMDWLTHLKGLGIKTPMKQIDEWARQIASGELGGDPGEGLERFFRRQEVKAREIAGTPAHMAWESEQEELLAFANRPEDMRERLRGESITWLGQDKQETSRLSGSTLDQWAADLVSGTKSEGDWQQFLRDKMKQLFPYFDPNLSFTVQADPYKSLLEATIGDTVDWSDSMLRDFSQLDDNGKPTGNAMSLRDFTLLARDPKKNPRAYSEGTPLFDQGMSRLAGLVGRLRGVG